MTDKITINMFKLKKLFPSISKLREKQFFHKLQSMIDGPHAELAQTILILFYRRKEIVHLAKSRIDCVLALLERLDNNL